VVDHYGRRVVESPRTDEVPARPLSATECLSLNRQWQDASDEADTYDALYNGGALGERQRRDILSRQGAAVDRMQELLDRQDAGGCFD